MRTLRTPGHGQARGHCQACSHGCGCRIPPPLMPPRPDGTSDDTSLPATDDSQCESRHIPPPSGL